MRCKLTPGAQVREEDFGLLFYTMAGPRLYFLSSGDLIGSDFFEGVMTIEQYIMQRFSQNAVSKTRISKLKTGLTRLTEKGVIVEC
jgi:putative mycofactocin binding protein MftB